MPSARDKNCKLEIEKNSRICVLMGGVSFERGISFKSGSAVYNSLKKNYKNTFAFDVKTEDKAKLKEDLKKSCIDAAFIALHGYFGEDGKIQKILDELSIPYTGSGPLASDNAMDKHKAKMIFKKANIPLAEYKVLYKNQSSFDFDKLDSFPYILKPSRGGSSIGLNIVRKKDDFKKACQNAFKYDSKIIIEAYIEGREFTVGILDDEPLEVIEIIPKSEFFDFKAKYKGNSTRYLLPANISADITNNIKELALLSHKVIGCKCFSRVDIMLDKYYNPFILEINTIPGLTDKSLLPKAAAARGISFDELCVKLLNSSSQWQK